MKDYTLFVILVIIVTFVVPPMYGSTFREIEAQTATEDSGFRDVTCSENHYIFPGFYGCAGSSAAWDCRATNANGNKVSVVACMGLFRGTSVRIR